MEAYVAPDIVEVGTIEELTQGNASGVASDAAFPAGTLLTDMTFTG